MDYYSSIKHRVLVTKLMELEDHILREISHTQENKHSMFLLISVKAKKFTSTLREKDTNY